MAHNDNAVLRPTGDEVEAFLAALEPERRRAEARTLIELMGRVSGEPAAMWGGGIIGFGSLHYRYESGREGDMPAIGFAPRTSAISLYLTGDASAHAAELAAIGKYRTGKACIYVNKLADIDLERLESFATRCYEAAIDSPPTGC